MPSPAANRHWLALNNRVTAVVFRLLFMTVFIQGLYKYKGLKTHPAVPESTCSAAFLTRSAFRITLWNV